MTDAPSDSKATRHPSPPRRKQHFEPAVVQDLTPQEPKERGVAWKGPDVSSVAVIWFPTAMIQISASVLTYRGWERASPFVTLTPALAAQVAQGIRDALALRTHVCACGRIHEFAKHSFIKRRAELRRYTIGRKIFDEFDDEESPEDTAQQRYHFTVVHEPEHDEFRFIIHPGEGDSTRSILLTAVQLSEIAETLLLIANGHRPFRCDECTKPIADEDPC